MQDRLKNNIDNCLAVFQGGGCKAIAYIGAYEAAMQKGVVFSEVAGTSAGSIIAALIAAGSTPKEMKDFLNRIDFKKIAKVNIMKRFWWTIGCLAIYVISAFVIDLCPIPHAWVLHVLLFILLLIPLLMLILPPLRHLGYNSTKCLQHLLNEELCSRVGKNGKKDIVYFKDLYKPLYVVSADIIEKEEKVFFTSEKYSNMSVAEAVCASCSIPVFFRPFSKQHVDGGLVSNSPIHIFAHQPSYHRILSFQLEESGEKLPRGFKAFLERLISTIVEGGTRVQQGFGIQVDSIIIPISGIKATDFDKLNTTKINDLVETGKDITLEKLAALQDKALASRHSNALNEELRSYDQLYSLIATYSREKVSDVIVSAPDTKWSWHIFPTLVKWTNDKANIYVFCERNPQNRDITKYDEELRRKRLESFGCVVDPIPKLDANAFFIKIGNQWRGAIYNEKLNPATKLYEFEIGCYYDHIIDSTAIEAWVEKLEKNENKDGVFTGEVTIQKEEANAIINPIQQNCPMYTTANVEYRTIGREQMEELLFLTGKIRMYKYRQIGYLFKLYDDKNLPYFSPAKLIRPSKINSVIGPIVIEQKDGKNYVVEGHTRLLYAYMNNITELEVLYVRNASRALDFPQDFTPRTIKQLIVTDNKEHNKLDNPNFRHIEAALRDTLDSLPEQA